MTTLSPSVFSGGGDNSDGEFTEINLGDNTDIYLGLFQYVEIPYSYYGSKTTAITVKNNIKDCRNKTFNRAGSGTEDVPAGYYDSTDTVDTHPAYVAGYKAGYSAGYSNGYSKGAAAKAAAMAAAAGG